MIQAGREFSPHVRRKNGLNVPHAEAVLVDRRFAGAVRAVKGTNGLFLSRGIHAALRRMPVLQNKMIDELKLRAARFKDDAAKFSSVGK